MLIALCLALLVNSSTLLNLRNNSSRHVRQSDRALRLVHMLPSRPGRAVTVDDQVFRLNGDGVAAIGEGRHDYGGEGGVSSAVLVKRGDSNQTVDSTLAGEVGSDIISIHAQCGTADAGSLFLGGDAFPLPVQLPGQSLVHLQQHPSPVARVLASCARVEVDEGRGIGSGRSIYC